MEEKEDRDSNTKQNEITPRPSLKSDSPFNNYQLWKHKLRDNCYKRVREDRTRLLWKFRCNQHDDIVKSALEDIVSDEFYKMKHTDDLLWDYEGPPDTTYKGECEDILLEMQRIFYQDLNSQPPLQRNLLSLYFIYHHMLSNCLLHCMCLCLCMGWV